MLSENLRDAQHETKCNKFYNFRAPFLGKTQLDLDFDGRRLLALPLPLRGLTLISGKLTHTHTDWGEEGVPHWLPRLRLFTFR